MEGNGRATKDILTKIALQIGSEVSVRELANSLGANAVTVSNYIEIFIKNYILVPLPSFKTNIRKAVSEIEKKRKNTNAKQTMYFYREYGGQEVDLVLEDYKKEYICIEMKVDERRISKDIFPLAHSFTIINTQNYFKEITRLLF